MTSLRPVTGAPDGAAWHGPTAGPSPVFLPHETGHARRAIRVLALALLVVCSCTRPQLPLRLAGMRRTRVWTGARATRMIADMHGKQAAPRTTMVADYGTGSELRVYLSLYPDDAAAFRVLERMITGMRSGTTPFTTPRQEGSSGRWLTFGPGGHHELWVSRGRLYWLQGSPDIIQRAAAELPHPSPGTWT